MVNGCYGKTLLNERIFIFTNTTTFVKILISYENVVVEHFDLIGF